MSNNPISEERLRELIANHGVYVLPDSRERAQHRDVEAALLELLSLRQSSPDAGASSAPKAVTADELTALEWGARCIEHIAKNADPDSIMQRTVMEWDVRKAATIRSLASRLSSAQGEK